MTQLEVHYEKNAVSAAQKAAAAIAKIIKSYDFPVLFLASGGSPLEIIKYLPVFGANVTVTVSDERFTSDPAINNFAQIMHVSAKNWIDTRPLRGESLQECGERFDRALKQWKQKNPGGKIVMTQGIGLDGHTVGMIGKIFNDPGVWAVGYEAKNKYPLRVTTTAPFLRMVDDSVLYVCGKEKLSALQDALRVTPLRPPLSKIPAGIIHEMKHCLLFTDLHI